MILDISRKQRKSAGKRWKLASTFGEEEEKINLKLFS